MMIRIRQSIQAANCHIKYVPLLALGMFTKGPYLTRIYYNLSVILLLIFYPIVYGRILETIRNEKASPWKDLLSNYACNYLFFVVIMSIPVVSASYLYSDMDYPKKIIFDAVLGICFQIATLYMLPLLFINRRVLRSISQGFSSLLDYAWKNTPMILLILLSAIVKTMALLSLIYIFQSTDIYLVYGLGYFQNLINAYINLIIFSLAAAILLGENNGVHISPFPA